MTKDEALIKQLREALIKQLREGQIYDFSTGYPSDMSLIMDDAADMLEALAQPSDALDAARYRWLRDPCSNLANCYYSRGDYGRGFKNTTMLDEAIDAAKGDKK